MSISPQLRQLFHEVMDRESRYFKKPDKSFDKDGLLAAIIHSIEQDTPQFFAAFTHEATFTAGRRLLTDRFRHRPRRYRRVSGDVSQGQFYLEIPGEGGGFYVKEATEATLADYERRLEYYDAMIEGWTARRNYTAGIVSDMREKHLADTDEAGNVLEEIPA